MTAGAAQYCEPDTRFEAVMLASEDRPCVHF